MKLNHKHETFKTFAERNLDFLPPVRSLSREQGKKFIEAIKNYHNKTEELTYEDLGYIRTINHGIWNCLEEIVDHWELRRWEKPNGEISVITPFFSLKNALQAYNVCYMTDSGYYDLIAVDKDGNPKPFAQKFSNF